MVKSKTYIQENYLADILNSSKKILKIVGIIVLVWILIFFIKGIFVVVESWFVGVKYRFWKIDYNELTPWLHIVNPVLDKVKLVNVRVKVINYKWQIDISDNYKEWIINKPAITVLDKRWLPISVELTVLYQLKQTEAAETVEKYWFLWDEKLVNPTVREVVRDIMWWYEAENVPEKRQEIADKIKSSLQEKFKDSVVNLVDVQLRNIELPSRVKEKILQVQIAKQEAEKQKYELEKAKIEAETKKVRAEAEAKARIERAKWEAEAIKLKAEAQAEANRKLSNSITPNLIKYKFIEKWNGRLPKIIWGNGQILNIPGDILKF